MIRKILREIYRRVWVLPRLHRTYGSLTIAETFRRIYSTKAWGDPSEKFSSGWGSRGPVSEKYTTAVIEFIRRNGIRTVVDLGCGDYVVSSRMVDATDISYTGIDVVPDLIEHHSKTVANPRATFKCLDISSDPLPPADLYLIRQVLQHLSNAEIEKVLSNVAGASRILISEDVPVHPKSYNRDKTHGPDVRRYYGSGVYVDQPPFSHQVVELWNFPLDDDSRLRTVLLDRTPAPA